MILPFLDALLFVGSSILRQVGFSIPTPVDAQTDPLVIFLLFMIVLLLGVISGITVWTLRTSLSPTYKQPAPASSTRAARTPTTARRMAVSPDRAGFVRSVIEDTPTPPPMPLPLSRQYVTWPPTGSWTQPARFSAMLIDQRNPRARYDVSWPIVNIGRATSNTLQVPDLLVSRQHACLRQELQGYCLLDLGSANGTYVNHQRINRMCFLTDGDIITIGQTEFIFRQFA